MARILRDERYTGKNIYGRRTRDIVGDPHTLQADRDTWVEVERMSAATTGRKKLDQKAAFDTLRTLQMEQGQLLRQLQRLYEALVEGAVSREDYAKKKQVLSAQLQQIETDMSVLEEKISMQNHAGEVAVIARYRDYEAIDALTAEVAAELLDRVTACPDGVLDIRLNYADELEALLAREIGEAV